GSSELSRAGMGRSRETDHRGTRGGRDLRSGRRRHLRSVDEMSGDGGEATRSRVRQRTHPVGTTQSSFAQGYFDRGNPLGAVCTGASGVFGENAVGFGRHVSRGNRASRGGAALWAGGDATRVARSRRAKDRR